MTAQTRLAIRSAAAAIEADPSLSPADRAAFLAIIGHGKPKSEVPGLLTTARTARALGVSVATVARLRRRNILKPVRLPSLSGKGKRPFVRFKREDLDRFLRSVRSV